jgi:hypothetical protein
MRWIGARPLRRAAAGAVLPPHSVNSQNDPQWRKIFLLIEMSTVHCVRISKNAGAQV